MYLHTSVGQTGRSFDQPEAYGDAGNALLNLT